MNGENHSIRVRISKKIRGKMPTNATRSEWVSFYRSFKNYRLTVRDFASAIWRGYSFTPVFNGRRIKDNFEESWHIALDFDTCDENSSLESLSNSQMYLDYGAFCYETPSSTPEKPKSRLVFVFDEPMTNSNDLEDMYKYLLECYPFADRSTKDCLRLFYGSPRCNINVRWRTLPKSVAMRSVQEWRAMQPEPVERIPIKTSDRYLSRAFEDEVDRVIAAKENRNNTLLSAARSLGQLISCGLSQHDIESSLLNACRANGLLSEDGEYSILNTISRGIGYGIKSPRTVKKTGMMKQEGDTIVFKGVTHKVISAKWEKLDSGEWIYYYRVKGNRFIPHSLVDNGV